MGTIGLGVFEVRGRSRVPFPPANMSALSKVRSLNFAAIEYAAFAACLRSYIIKYYISFGSRIMLILPLLREYAGVCLKRADFL
jgi:hypothetical protein